MFNYNLRKNTHQPKVRHEPSYGQQRQLRKSNTTILR